VRRVRKAATFAGVNHAFVRKLSYVVLVIALGVTLAEGGHRGRIAIWGPLWVLLIGAILIQLVRRVRRQQPTGGLPAGEDGTRPR
jgi:hypothetical protein